MGRLIEVDDLIERIEDVLSREQHKQAEVPSWLQKIIDNLPTAYDVDKVLAEMNREQRKEVNAGVCPRGSIHYLTAIDIVKRGGIE